MDTCTTEAKKSDDSQPQNMSQPTETGNLGESNETSTSLIESSIGQRALSSILGPSEISEIGPVTSVTTKQHLLAAATLSEAFEQDSVARYIVDVPDRAHWGEEKKWDLHCTIMNYITCAHAMRSLATAVGTESDPYGSVALWMYPNKTIESLPIMLSSGLWRLTYKLSSAGRKRGFREFFPLLAKTKNEVLGPRSKDCYYLVYIGTKPSCRGMGLAKRLIQDAAQKADKEGKAMYLESSAERNLKFYRSLGFEVKKRIWLAGTNPRGERIPMDIMVREPGGLLSMQAVDSGISMTPQATEERSESTAFKARQTIGNQPVGVENAPICTLLAEDDNGLVVFKTGKEAESLEESSCAEQK